MSMSGQLMVMAARQRELAWGPGYGYGLSALGSSASLHQMGRAALLAAWPGVAGETPSLAELQMAGAVANFESLYGTGHFFNELTNSNVPNQNNWGAVMCTTRPPCPTDTCLEATDHGGQFKTADNPGGSFQACFKAFPTSAAGAAFFIKQITSVRPASWAAMKTGDIDQFSLHMLREHYYGGCPVDASEAIRAGCHAAAVAAGVKEIAAAMGEPIAAWRENDLPLPFPPTPPGGLSPFPPVPAPSFWSLALALAAGLGAGYAGTRYLERRFG